MAAPTKRTTFGSGTLYVITDTSVQLPAKTKAAIKTFVETYCTEDNQLGYLKDGFTIDVETENIDDQSDLGEMRVTTIKSEKANATFAIFNANIDVLERIYPTAVKAAEDVLTVGGLNGVSQDDLLFVYVEATKQQGKQSVVIGSGKNMSGFSVKWSPDGVEPFSCEYSLAPLDSQGLLYYWAYIENLPTLPITGSTVYSIEFITNGGEWAASYEVPESYVHGSGSDITLPTSSNISKTGATFGGWFETSDLGTAVTTIDVSEDSGNKTYYAKWTE